MMGLNESTESFDQGQLAQFAGQFSLSPRTSLSHDSVGSFAFPFFKMKKYADNNFTFDDDARI